MDRRAIVRATGGTVVLAVSMITRAKAVKTVRRTGRLSLAAPAPSVDLEEEVTPLTEVFLESRRLAAP